MMASDEKRAPGERNSSLSESTGGWWPHRLLERALGAAGTSWERVALLATTQHGVAAHWQLNTLGISPSAVCRACVAGHLHRLHRGVYAVGHRSIGPRGSQMAAVLACSPDAWAIRLSATDIHGVRIDGERLVEVGVQRDSRLAHAGISVHRLAGLTPADITVRQGIPVTSLARTLLDIAPLVGEGGIREALSQAHRSRILDRDDIAALIERSSGFRGVGILRAATAELRGAGLTSLSLIHI